MSEYGLPDTRDSEGERKAVEHTYDWNGREVTIKLLPPTISEQQEYEQLGDEADAEELAAILDTHLVEPDHDDYTTREMLCYIEGIVDYGVGGGGEVAHEVREEIDARKGTAGN